MDEETQAGPAPPKENEISVALLTDVKKLIDVAISRGAFRPEELSSVGKVYDSFQSVLNNMSN
jgi:hypothetical protein